MTAQRWTDQPVTDGSTRGVLSVFVPGRPAPQGSKRYVGQARSGKGILVESSAAVKPWRADVRSHLLGPDGGPLVAFSAGVPVFVLLTFVLPRPASAPKRVIAATKHPDLDKLTRAVLDAMTSAGVLHDDSQVVRLHVQKLLTDQISYPFAGCAITASRTIL